MHHTGINARYNGSGLRGAVMHTPRSALGPASERLTARTGGYTGGYGGGGRDGASDARSLRSAQHAAEGGYQYGAARAQAAPNPMAGPMGDSADEFTRSAFDALLDDMPWLFQLQRYAVLSSEEAEAMLLACMRDMSRIVSDLFQVETEMATQPNKELNFAVLSEAMTTIITILTKLPESAFVDYAGRPDANFHNVVQGLCHLWGSLDIAQLSSVTRLLSLTRPAEAVAQAATQSRIRLPPQQRFLRDFVWSAAPERHAPCGYAAIIVAALGTVLCIAVLFGVLPQGAAFVAYAMQALAYLTLLLIHAVGSANRNADKAMRVTIGRSVSAGFARVSTSALDASGAAGSGDGGVSLAGLGNKAGPGQAQFAQGAPSQVGAASGQVGDGGGDEWSRYQPPPHIAYRYPDGVLIMPAGRGPNGEATWVCIDARPLNKHTMVIGLDPDRRVSIWNSSAADATGFTSDARVGLLVKECLSAPGDTLFRLPRMVGDHAVLQLHNVVSNNTMLPFVVGDMRDLAGEPAGHCFVAPSIREDFTSMRSYLHEYLQHEMWEGLAYCDAIAKQLKELFQRAEAEAVGGQVVLLAPSQGGGSSSGTATGAAAVALRPKQSKLQTLHDDNARRASSDGRRQSSIDGGALSGETHPIGRGAGQLQSRNASGGESIQRGGVPDDMPAELEQLAVDLRLLHTSIQREVSKMRLSVRLMGWDTLSNTSRLIATQWEWTNGERMLGAAARYHFAKASVGVETNVPPSFRLPASAARIIKAIINFAPSHCTVFLQYSQRSRRVGRVTVTVTLVHDGTNATHGSLAGTEGPGAGERNGSAPSRGSIAQSSVTLQHLRRSHAHVAEKFDFDVLTAQIGREVFECCATVQMFSDDTAVSVHFPCVRDVEDADAAAGTSAPTAGNKKPSNADSPSSLGPQQDALPPTVATFCDCVVAVCLEQPMDQHNLGMMLLGITGVSLTICRDVADLQSRLPTVDMVIIANAYRAEIEVDDDIDAVVIPVVDEDAPYQADASFLRLPLVREDVFRLIVEASEVVADNKRAREEAREREKVLQARHDATWTKGALLGRGTFGVCYSATNDLTGGRMAVKQFEFVPRRAEGLDDADAERERFMTSLVNEIRILTKLDHPNIVHYFHCERTDSGVNLFMELCEGSLHDVIKKHRTRDRNALYHRVLPVIVQQTLNAVAYLHNLNIIHRDLKPQNILTKGDRVKLTDFGTAHQVSQDETLHDTQGTLRFMAPEVYRAESYNWSCDVWSIGCIICEMLDVRVPFMQPGQHHMLGDLQQADIRIDESIASHISDEARDFISLCLQVKPGLRPAMSTLLLHPFVESLGSPVRLSTLMGGSTNSIPTSDPLGPGQTPAHVAPAPAAGDVQAPHEDEMLPPAVVADFSGDGFSLDSQA